MYANCTSLVTIRRRTSRIVESAAAGQTLSVARQPVRASVLEVTVSGGQTGSGSVYVTGLVAGATVTEALVYTAPGVKQTARLFTSVAGMTTSGLGDETPPPTIMVRAIGRDGSDQAGDYVLVTGYPAGIQDQAQMWGTNVAGGNVQDGHASILLPYSETWSPREGDLVDDDQGRTWRVKGPPPRGGGLQPEFWQLKAQRFEVRG